MLKPFYLLLTLLIPLLTQAQTTVKGRITDVKKTAARRCEHRY